MNCDEEASQAAGAGSCLPRFVESREMETRGQGIRTDSFGLDTIRLRQFGQVPDSEDGHISDGETMSRGFKVDKLATMGAQFEDERSFISLPKRTHGPDEESHLILYGKKDKGIVRAEIFRRNRAQFRDGYPRCAKCNRIVSESSESSCGGEWHHIRNKPGERCDCPENGEVLCRRCHRPEHPQTKFTKRGSECQNVK
jgi:hypothetical protein